MTCGCPDKEPLILPHDTIINAIAKHMTPQLTSSTLHGRPREGTSALKAAAQAMHQSGVLTELPATWA